MDRKTLIIILVAIIIIICLVFGLSSKDNENMNVVENSQPTTSLNYNEVVDETTGETYYQLYDEETGDVVRNVVDDASLQMYLDNPDFVEPENEENYDNGQMLEYNEDGSVKEISIIE